MNKFGTREMRPLIDGLRARAHVLKALASPQPDELEQWLVDAADSLEAAHGYFSAVEGALA
jgi:hypothetical protein